MDKGVAEIMLSDGKILEYIEAGEIIITPFISNNLGPNSYDLRIGSTVKKLDDCRKVKDLSKHSHDYTLMGLPLILIPGETILFCTQEVIGVKQRTLGLLGTRSNLARSGLQFQFSPLIDTGFKGIVSGAIHNPTKMTYKIPKNLRVLQVMFQEVNGDIVQTYNKRKWSKNLEQFDINSIEYKVDKEFKEE